MVYTFLMFLIWIFFGNFGKTAVFPGGYGRIGVYRAFENIVID